MQVKVSGKAPEVRADCAVGQLNDFIVVNGGCFREDAADPDSWQEDRSSNDTWIFSLTKHEWQQLDAGGLVPRARHHAVAFHDSMLLIGERPPPPPPPRATPSPLPFHHNATASTKLGLAAFDIWPWLMITCLEREFQFRGNINQMSRNHLVGNCARSLLALLSHPLWILPRVNCTLMHVVCSSIWMCDGGSIMD